MLNEIKNIRLAELLDKYFILERIGKNKLIFLVLRQFILKQMRKRSSGQPMSHCHSKVNNVIALAFDSKSIINIQHHFKTGSYVPRRGLCTSKIKEIKYKKLI